jgi:hypothetical protein
MTERPPFSYAERCDKCGKCQCALRADEPVWRRLVGIGRGYFGGWRTAIVPVCERCATSDRDLPEYSTGSCGNCGRTVHDTTWRRFPRRWVFCCDACRSQHQSAYQAAIARQRRADARGPSRPCLACGEHFEPTRTDAHFCSGACRQKHYRLHRALRLANGGHCSQFESRNAAGGAP